MEYEGKNKIIYIGTVVLFVIFILLYAVYFLVDHPENNKKRTTSDAIQVTTSKEQEEISINGEIIAKEISGEISMVSKPNKGKTGK